MRLKDYVVISSEKVLGTYKLGNSNHKPNSFAYKSAAECGRFLEESGFDGMRVSGDDGMFPYLNVLANFAFYSGCLRKNVQITMPEEVLREISSKILPRLGLEGEIKYSARGKREPTLFSKANGAYVARTLESMGIPRSCGNKAKIPNLSIPSYRKNLIASAVSGDFDEGDAEAVRKLERDSTAVLFSARLHPTTRKNLWLHFFTRSTPEDAERFAKEGIGIINFAVPGIGLDEKDIRTEKNGKGGHYSAINLRGDKLEFVLDGNNDLLKFSPRLQQLYGLDLPFEPAEIR
jgi:hypothetical protein